jgi:ATP-binding cassette subfamily B protein
VLDRGQIVEIGQHEDLLARKGAYYALYEAQNQKNEEDGVVVSPPKPLDEVNHA